MITLGEGNWRKASYSNSQGACVEAASGSGTVAVRDTADRTGPALSFSAASWAAFTRRLA